MTDRQKKLLLELKSKKEDFIHIDHPFDILIHSVLNTIKISDLIRIYIDDNIVEIKMSIFSNIEKRIEYCEENEKNYEDLKFMLENGVTYFKSQRIRKILEILLTQLDDDYKYDFFNTFFYSKYSNDKKAALNYVLYAKKEIHVELLNEYLTTGNPKYLKPLLNKKYINFLAENVERIWILEPSFFYKKQIIELLSKTNFDKLNFIMDEEFDLYILVNLINLSSINN